MRRPGEAYDRDAPCRTYALSTRSDTYFMSARSAREALEVMGWTFDHDGIEDRKILTIQRLGRREIRLTDYQRKELNR